MNENRTDEREVRFMAARELRAEQAEDGKPKISGYAAPFNVLSEDLGGFREEIRPGAFKKTLNEGDQRALWNHDTNLVLGRRKAGTLDLAEDEIGLRFTIYPPETQAGRDALESIRRGDVDQMSFAFQVVREEWRQDGEQILRSLNEVRLYQVSPVAFPAYPQTSAFVRSKINESTVARRARSRRKYRLRRSAAGWRPLKTTQTGRKIRRRRRRAGSWRTASG